MEDQQAKQSDELEKEGSSGGECVYRTSLVFYVD